MVARSHVGLPSAAVRVSAEAMRDAVLRIMTCVRLAVAAVIVVAAIWVAVSLDDRSAGRPTTTSPSTSSTGRSAASRADRSSRRSAACCRRTGSSRRCRRSAATSCRAATPRSASIFEPDHDLPIGVSRRRRLGIDQVGLNCARVPHRAPCATRRRRAPRIVLGMPAQQLDLQSLRPVRAGLHARQPD